MLHDLTDLSFKSLVGIFSPSLGKTNCGHRKKSFHPFILCLCQANSRAWRFVWILIRLPLPRLQSQKERVWFSTKSLKSKHTLPKSGTYFLPWRQHIKKVQSCCIQVLDQILGQKITQARLCCGASDSFLGLAYFRSHPISCAVLATLMMAPAVVKLLFMFLIKNVLITSVLQHTEYNITDDYFSVTQILQFF